MNLVQLWTWLASASAYADFSKDVRPGFFTGFLTVTGFLVAAHTFIIIHMKKEMFDQDWYRARVDKARMTNPQHSYYGSLRRLSRLLMATIIASLLASLSQVTIGLIHANWVVVLCSLLPCVAFGMLLWSIWVMATNLRSWFDSLEDAANNTSS
jgi:hypothetical protein